MNDIILDSKFVELTDEELSETEGGNAAGNSVISALTGAATGSKSGGRFGTWGMLCDGIIDGYFGYNG